MEQIYGNQIELPLVHQIGAIRSHQARRITWHEHTVPEVLFLVEGATAYEVTGGRTVALSGGQFLVMPPGLRHRGLHDVRSPSTICGISFDVRCNQATRNTPFSRQDLRHLSQRFDDPGLHPHPMGRELRRIITRLMEELTGLPTDSLPPLAGARIRGLACAALLETAYQLQTSRPAELSVLMDAAVKFLQKHYVEPIGIAEMVRHLGLSRTRIFELFKSATGMTPNDYLLRLRVDKAKELLETNNLSITTIAFDTGFSSSQYFGSVFRKYTGKTPREYRQATDSATGGKSGRV